MKRSDFTRWQENPVTVEIFRILNERREYSLEIILNAVPDYPEKNSLLALGKLIGTVNAYDSLLKVDFDSLDVAEEDSNADKND